MDLTLPYTFAFTEPGNRHNAKALQTPITADGALGTEPDTQAAKDNALDSLARKPISETRFAAHLLSLADWLTSNAVQCAVLDRLHVGFCAKDTVCGDRSLRGFRNLGLVFRVYGLELGFMGGLCSLPWRCVNSWAR